MFQKNTNTVLNFEFRVVTNSPSKFTARTVRSSLPVLAAEEIQMWMEQGYEQRKRPSPQKEDEGRMTHLENRTAPPASRPGLGQAMPILGVSRIAACVVKQDAELP
jgi:hypothetical protein